MSEGDLAGAQRLLADALTDADPRPGNASPELADAAGLQARVLVALGEPHSARGWAAFAYAANTRLHGRSDERTVTAAATLAAVLHRVGSDARAARLYSDVIIELTARDGPESQRVLAAHADLATVEYSRGQCQLARDRLQDAWELHREVYGDGHPSGIKMLAKLGAMERDCGRYAESHEHLALAEDLCALHLAPDDPLATQVSALARAAADPDHACAAPEPAAEPPVVPAARVPPAAEGPPEPLLYHPPRRTGPPAEPVRPAVPTPRLPLDPDDDHPADAHDPSLDDDHPPFEAYHPSPYGSTGPADDISRWPGATASPDPYAEPADGHPGPAHPHAAPVDDRDATADPYAPAGSGPGSAGPYDLPTDRRADPYGGSADRHAGPGHFPGDSPAHGGPVDDRDEPTDDRAGRYDGPADDDWWPPEEQFDADDPSAGETALPPAVVGLTGEESAGVRRVSRAAEPESPSRYLPVHVPRPPVPERRATPWLPLVVIGVVVALLLGVVAVIAGVSRVDRSQRTAAPAGSAVPSASRPASPTGTPKPPPAATGTPPGRVRLTDRRDSILLSWTYPSGAEGPVVIAGGRSRDTQHTFQELPAGTDSYVAYGLSRTQDYCFTVAVVWSTDVVARAAPVCTRRG
ncbi:tetratricopeptide repeat protein [Micromonospora auratinigra]|uniref:tetratricopeptide repeat protein n=1 Tax=Micromonospora auratinigra TaxID=261654 RepID=UPI0038B2E244